MPRFLLEKHKLIYHPEVLAKFLAGELFAPITVEISPAARCNQGCKSCYTAYVMNSKKSPPLLEKSLYFKAIRDCANFGVKAISICGTGEPLLNQYTPKAISYAKSLGMDVALVTNGVLADKARMESCLKDITWVRISTSAGSARRYAQLQGSTESAYFQMMSNMRELVKIKQMNNLQTTIGVAYFLFEGCEEDIKPFVNELKEIGVDYVQIKPCGDFVKNKYIYKKDTYRNSADKLRELDRLNSKEFLCQIKYDRFQALEEIENKGFRLPGKCWGLLFFGNIGSDGKVYTCRCYT